MRLLFFVLFVIGTIYWTSCNITPTNSDNVIINPADSLAIVEKEIQELKVTFSQSVSIRNSDYIIYPIRTNAAVEEKFTKLHFYGLRYGEKYNRDFLNLLFHNLQTNENHLLIPDTLALIKSYQIMGNRENENTNEKPIILNKIEIDRKKYIFYKIVRDINEDGKIDDKDPARLYTSNLNGKNLTLISPKDMHLIDWKFPKHNSNIIELILLEDSNQSGIFNSKSDRKIYLKTHLDSIGQFTPILDWELIKDIKSRYLYLDKKVGR